MGNCALSVDNNDPTLEVHKNQFRTLNVIGRGGFGQVWKVVHKRTKTIMAMKEMSKLRVVSKRSVESVLNERKILSLIKHPFIVNMQFAFQDRNNLYLCMDLMPGGDLRYHLCKHKKFSERQTKFFIACILTGLEYLHVNGIIHRDIKPENLVLDDKGYVRITDFGIARLWETDNSSETSGTPGYMAPEVMCRQNHSYSVDYFAVGVIVYEFMLGKRPYVGRNRREIRDSILSKQVLVKRQDLPTNWSFEAADFANKMLQRKPENRLGLNGPSEVKNHSWLRDINWHKILEKSIRAPFIPPKEDNFDTRHLMNGWNDESLDSMGMSQTSINNLFNSYVFHVNQPRQPTQGTKIWKMGRRSHNNSLFIGQFVKISKMEADPLSRLRGKLEQMRRERDQLNNQVLQERSMISELEAELARKQREYLSVKSRLDQKEDYLQRISNTIRESEVAYSKLLTNTDKLISALEQESSNLSKQFR